MPPTEDSLKKNASQQETDSSDPKSSQEDKANAPVEPSSPTEIVAGKIQKIFLRNFLSFESKEIVLNDKVNVFVGPNGSGKSAILTALAVGLGANLKRFGQDNKKAFLKGLIKDGEVEATIEITLSNVGTNANEPDVYGETITVSTTIESAGSADYQIKNNAGDVISTTMNALKIILKQLNIQVDNPICILNQDFARIFLIISDDTKMYEFFSKATQIDVLMQKLEEMETDLDDSEKRLDEAIEYVIDTEKKIKDIETSLEVAQPELKADLEKQLIEKRESYNRVSEDINKLKTNIIKQEGRLKKHKIDMKRFVDAIGQKVQYCFQEVLRTKNYQGSITIDHEQKTLGLEVNPAIGSQGMSSDAEALPGDLLAKIAFFLALLDCNDLPFSFVDEFDVFMNNDQRHFAMGMVLEYMKQRPSKQFGFLTPLDTAHIESDETISIYKFADLMGNGEDQNN